VDWNLAPAQQEMLQFTRQVFALRAAIPLLHCTSFFSPEPRLESGIKEIVWLTAEGREMEAAHWRDPANHVLGMLLQSNAVGADYSSRGAVRETWLLLLNGGGRSCLFALPTLNSPGEWIEVLNTAHPVSGTPQKGGISLSPRSLVLLRRPGSLRPLLAEPLPA
jgi:isoamylase